MFEPFCTTGEHLSTSGNIFAKMIAKIFCKKDKIICGYPIFRDSRFAIIWV